MTIVVDASMAAAWLLPDEGDAATHRVFTMLRTSFGLVPSIFRHELRNIILLSERRSRITPAIADALLIELARLPIRDCGSGDDAQIVAIARAHALTAYDAAYVSLALSDGAPLATLDKAMASAARTCGVAILGPLAP